jgi:hypothetical protein
MWHWASTLTLSWFKDEDGALFGKSNSKESHMDPYHDIGGQPGSPLDLTSYESSLWERRVDAMLRLLSSKCKLMTVDELRRGIETLGEDRYDKEIYYGKWAFSIASIMVEKGVITQEELEQRSNIIRARMGNEQ